MRRREPEPIEEQDREDAARRADEARSDAEDDAAWVDWQRWCGNLADARAILRANDAEIDRIDAARDASLDATERLDTKEGL